MADKANYLKKQAKVSNYAYPSYFGSHTSMIDEEETAKLDKEDLVACRDEYGVYTTNKNRLDSGCADPNRFRESRLEKLFKKNEKE